MVAIGDKVKYRSDGEIAPVVAVHWGICGEEIGVSVDIVSDGPVRTVTRQEIVPGTYDGVVVGNVGVNGVQVAVRIDDGFYDADTLTRAAAVLTALAGALRDEQ